MSISAEEKNRYLRETAIVLAREGFHTDRTHTGGLRVLLDGAPLCEVTENGGITYRNEDIDEPERLDAKDKVYEIVRITAEYAADLMKLLDEVLPYLSTDMTNSQIMLLAAKCIPIMGSAELSSYRVPADDAYHYASIRGMSVVVPDLDKIHEDLLNEYLPLNAEKESSE